MSEQEGTVTFVLTGPREGYTGFLSNGRYGFKDGELTVPQSMKEGLKTILCNAYACNIKGEAPIWESKDGASVKVGEVEKPKAEVTTVKADPVHTTTDKKAAEVKAKE